MSVGRRDYEIVTAARRCKTRVDNVAVAQQNGLAARSEQTQIPAAFTAPALHGPTQARIARSMA